MTGTLLRNRKTQALRIARFAFVCAISLLTTMNAVVHAQPGTVPTPANLLFRNPDVMRPLLSPDGNHMAVLARRSDKRDRLNIAVINLDTNKSAFVTPFDDSDVVEMHWVNSNRLIFTTGNVLESAANTVPWRQGGMFAIDRDGNNARRLVSPLGTGDTVVLRPRYSIFLQAIGEESEEVIVAANDNNFDGLDVYRLNTRTARKTLMTLGSPGDARTWVLDKNGMPRATVTMQRTRASAHWRPLGENAKWQKLSEGEFTEQGSAVYGFDYDGSLLVSTYASRAIPIAAGGLGPAAPIASQTVRDTAAVVRADPQTGQFREWVFAHPRVDHNELVFDPIKKKLVGVRFIDERLQTHWLDETWRSVQRNIDQTLPGQINYFTPPQQNKRMLVVSSSPKNPGSVYEYDFAKRKLNFLFDFRGGMSIDSMADARYVKFNARDGLPLAAVIASPLNAPTNKPAPTVVIAEGGPWVQSPCLCWNPDIQYFAQRGFAVIVPTFRGQLGLGHRHWVGGAKQWGLAMQDDIADAVDYAVKQGIADPARVAIVGTGYGGYAALQGAVRTPNLYKAVAAMAAPTDLQLFQSITWADYSDTAFQKFIAPVLIGDENKDAEQLRITSPVNNATAINASVLLAYGGEDRRIPQQHGTRMRDALERAGKQIEWLYKNDEGHGFAKTENRVEFFTRAETMIRKAFGMSIRTAQIDRGATTLGAAQAKKTAERARRGFDPNNAAPCEWQCANAVVDSALQSQSARTSAITSHTRECEPVRCSAVGRAQELDSQPDDGGETETLQHSQTEAESGSRTIVISLVR
jgi:dipeptidyl aminopeptidase/acylaminoacyl peptidase